MNILEIPVFTKDRAVLRDLFSGLDWETRNIYAEFDSTQIKLNNDFAVLFYLLEPTPDEPENPLFATLVPKAPFCLFWFPEEDSKLQWFFDNFSQLFETPAIPVYSKDDNEEAELKSERIGQPVYYQNDETDILKSILLQMLNRMKSIQPA
jgi:hypothetical protein